MPSIGGCMYRAFLPQDTAGGDLVVAVVERGDGVELETVVPVSDAASATVLAGALNGILLRQVTAERRIAAALDGAPTSVRAAIEGLVPDLSTAGDDDSSALRVVERLPVAGPSGVALFPTTNCGRCEVCGACPNDCQDCEECADGGCETFLPVTVTPRTAAVLHHALAVLADEAYDHAYARGFAIGDQVGLLGAVPGCATDQDEFFLRRYARAFDDLAGDLEAGRWPLPSCTAEEVALDLAIRDAARIYHDEDELVAGLEEGLPSSRFDYDFDNLQDVLFQDKDYEGLLYTNQPLSVVDCEMWFEAFDNIPDRDHRRGYRR